MKEDKKFERAGSLGFAVGSVLLLIALMLMFTKKELVDANSVIRNFLDD